MAVGVRGRLRQVCAQCSQTCLCVYQSTLSFRHYPVPFFRGHLLRPCRLLNETSVCAAIKKIYCAHTCLTAAAIPFGAANAVSFPWLVSADVVRSQIFGSRCPLS